MEGRMENVIQADGLVKKYKGFELSVPRFGIPKGFATALIGENGAGKTTLLNILTGIRMDFKGHITYFGDENKKMGAEVQERLGYTGPGCYFLPQWIISQVRRDQRTVVFQFSRGQIPEYLQ